VITAIADAGFFVALLNSGDRHHAAAREIFDSNKYSYVTTLPVLTEACHLLAHRLSAQASVDLMRSAAAGDFAIAQLPQDLAMRAHTLMQRYINLPMDLADASLVILAEELGHGRILSTDRRDFDSYRWKSRKPFQNLMFPDD
jgi:predicted nucleic acid-binding protein